MISNNNTHNTNIIPRDRDELIRVTTENYLSSPGFLAFPMTDAEIRRELMAMLEQARDERNIIYSDKIPKFTSLPNACIVSIMLNKYHIINITCNGVREESRNVHIYMESGKDKGLYVPIESVIGDIIHEFKFNYTVKDKEDIISALEDRAPMRERCKERDLIAVNNGIFDYKSKTLRDFTPDLVFTCKCPVDYVCSPIPVNPHFTMPDGQDWDFDSWLESISDDPEIVDLLLKVIGAVLRPNVRWDKIVCMYSQVGMNGKGTICELMKQLCGEGFYASIPFVGFARDTLLNQLLRASAIITDENAVNAYAKDVSKLKSVATGDSIEIDRKYRSAITFRFSGLIVECVNSLPRAADQTDSFYRRFLMIPFDKTFKGIERKYIKSDYLHRPEVLEYVLWKVMNIPDYYELPEPKMCEELMSEYREYNDPVVEFAKEIIPMLTWNKVPLAFMYDCFCAHFRKNTPAGILMSRKEFKIRITQYIADHCEDWEYVDDVVAIGKDDNQCPEMLILEYGLEDWKSSYTGLDPKKICTPEFKASYRNVFVHNINANTKEG